MLWIQIRFFNSKAEIRIRYISVWIHNSGIMSVGRSMSIEDTNRDHFPRKGLMNRK